MRKDKIIEGYYEIKKAFPDAMLSNTYRLLLIPKFPLPKQFNKPYTPLLIKINPDLDVPPEVYVDRTLRVNGEKSFRLDENITEIDMLEKGWVKICLKINWSPNFSLIDFMILVIDCIKNLKE